MTDQHADTDDEQTMIHLALNHGMELLCFTIELSSDPDEPKTL